MASELVIVPLTRQIFDLDLAAYRSSPRAISAHSWGRWPGDDLSREEACRLIDVHEKEHAAGAAYAYAILDADGARELGCVYLRPLCPFLARTGTRLDTTPFDLSRTAIVTFWLIDDQEARPGAGSGRRGRLHATGESIGASCRVLVRWTAKLHPLPHSWKPPICAR